MERIVQFFENLLFGFRTAVIVFFVICTCLLLWSASYIKIDAGFEKNIPLEHEYMQTFVKHQQLFGGANRILVAVEDIRGDIFNPEALTVLKNVNDEIFFIEGVDRSRVISLFTPSTRYIEVVEDGFTGGPVIPADFKPVQESIEQVRKNTIKANVVGRLVSNDFSCGLVAVQLQEINPKTGERLDYIEFSKKLEKLIREKYQKGNIKIHIIGFAKMIGDIAEGTRGVIFFFALAILITFTLVYIYCRSARLSIMPVICSIVAVIWQLGLLNAVGFGMDPMAILVPFLVFAIGVSHGMQMINGMGNNVASGMTPLESARNVFHRLCIPGSVALLSDTVGFLTLLLIKIGMIQELAINASLGVASIILTNLILLPILLSYLKFDESFKPKYEKTLKFHDRIWQPLSHLAHPNKGLIAIIVALLIVAFGFQYALKMKIGDLHAGAPALHEDSRYNMDTALITDRFSIGVDAVSIIVEAYADACTQFNVMDTIDNFHWHMENIEGVHSVISLPDISKIFNAAYNEGNVKWRVISRNTYVLTQATARIKSSTGLLNGDCSVIPIIIYTKDHKADTIERIVQSVKDYVAEHPHEKLNFRLATGPVGVMAAKNEAVTAAQNPMLLWVYGVVIVLCLLTFRSVIATICVIFPLVVVSILAQALMTLLQIGLTVSTLPILALGVGIGVDYGIYIVTPLLLNLRKGLNLYDAYLATLRTTGSAVMFTGFTLAVGVSTWIFSELKFQVDIGILLTFMFLLSMFGAILLLPSLAAQFWGKNRLKFKVNKG
ncbi:RND transporter [Candidatus Magnetomorum sp. HK-1]|nr:RND transporter [Candidatus Magnetomorum sp. HK-1]